MKKTKSNAKWAGLTAKQRETLEHWLFEEELSYDATLERAQKELGFTGSRASLQRFFRRATQERWLKKLAESGGEAAAMAGIPVKAGMLMASGMKLLGLQFFDGVRMEPEGLKDLPTLAKLLLQNEAIQVQREENAIRREVVELRRRAMDFAEKRWEFDLAEEAMKRLPELQEIKQARMDADDPYAEGKRVNAILRRLAGDMNRPNMYPESAEEEAMMNERKAREAAQRQREHEESQARYEREQAAREAARKKAVPAKRPPDAAQEVNDPPPERVPEPPLEDWAVENPFPFNDPEKVRKLGFDPFPNGT